MRTVSLRLADLQRSVIPIGFEDENLHTQVRIDCKKLFEEYPTALPSLAVVPPKGTAYPAIVTKDGDYVVWDVTASDTTVEGTGEIQLTFVTGEEVSKSYVGKVHVMKSIRSSGTAPDPIQNWITIANVVLDSVAHAVESALHAPIIDDNGYWNVWDADEDEYVPTEYKAEGTDGLDGVGITSIEKTGTSGLVDTYTVTFTNGTSMTFTVTNGEDGTDGISPTATVTKSGKIATITITDKNGTTSVQLSDGEDADPTELIDDSSTGAGKTWSAQKLDAEKQSLLTEINSKQDAPETAGTAGQVFGLDSNLDPVWIDQTGGGSVDPSAIAKAVGDWCNENITEDPTVVIDKSMSVAGAAAEAKEIGVRMQKCDLAESPKSANLWDDAHKNPGWFHKNGTVYNYDGWYYFDIGAVSQGDVIDNYYVENGTVYAGTMYAVVCIDSNDQTMQDASADSVLTFTVPSGVAKIIVTIRNPTATTMVVKNTAKPSAFIPYSDSYYYYVAGDGFIPDTLLSGKVDKNGEGQVTAKNLQIIDYSPNLFDLTAITEDYLVNQGSGELNYAKDHSTSDWIPVEAQTDYMFSINKPKEVRYVWYNASKEYITGELDSSLNVKKLTAPSGAAYLRFSTTVVKELYIQIEKGESATPFREYGEAFILPQYKMSAETFIMNLPAKIYATTGIELNIYFENLVEDWTKYHWNVTCDIGKQMERGFVITPTDSNAGTHTLTIRAEYENVYVEKTASLIVTAAAAGSGVTKSLIVLGDSTTANGTTVTKLAGNFADDVMSIVLRGTKGTSPYLHEGRSGWTFYNYLSVSTDNAFYNPSTQTFDAGYYFTNSGVDEPDWFIINLGINDTFGCLTDRELQYQCGLIKERCDTMIDSILTSSPSTKIGLCLTIPPNHSQDAFGKDYACGQTRDRYKRNNVMFVDFMITEYDGKENDGIYLIPIYTNLDTVYNMGMESISVNARNTSITYNSPTINGAVHPVESGYWQIADVYTAFLKAQTNT